jgi:hypothetical protein
MRQKYQICECMKGCLHSGLGEKPLCVLPATMRAYFCLGSIT